MEVYIYAVLYPLWLRRATRWFFYLLLLGGVAAGVAVGFLWYGLGDIDRQLEKSPRLAIPQLQRADVGSSQNILLIGADTRWSDRVAGQRGRSDTMILLHLDPDQQQVGVLSIPRDLRIQIGGQTRKFNASYELGGAGGVVEAIHDNLGIKINHVFEINFGAFSGMVDALGCAWTDVDRRYYHRNGPGQDNYSEINLQPGYQKLCGTQALQFVRFRHTDDDYLRSFRQQDFLHQFSAQFGPSDMLEQREQIIDLVSRYMRTDLRGRIQIADLLRLLAFSATKPVYQVPWNGQDRIIDGLWYAIATPEQIQKTVSLWENPPVVKPSPQSRTPGSKRKQKSRPATGPLMENSVTWSAEQARRIRGDGWNIWLPALRPSGSYYVDGSPRQYGIEDGLGNMHPAYRAVLVDRRGNHWGVQGVGWDSPPLLRMVHENVRVDGRQLQYYWDGRKLRYCAWQQGGWWYWISNSLSRSLSSAQMISTCKSLRRF